MDGFTASPPSDTAPPNRGMQLLLLLLRLPASGRHYRGCRAQPCIKPTPLLLQEVVHQQMLHVVEAAVQHRLGRIQRGTGHLLGLDLPVPDHSTIGRRARTVKLPTRSRSNGEPLHLLVDSTGIKMLGEGALLALLPTLALLRFPSGSPDADDVHDGGVRLAAVWASLTPQALVATAVGVALSRQPGSTPLLAVGVVNLMFWGGR